MSKTEFDTLMATMRSRQAAGELPDAPTDAQRADWAYGQAVLENPAVTRAMAQRAVAEKPVDR